MVNKMKIRRDGMYRKYVKRPMDVILASIAIIILSPLLLIIAVLVKAKLGSPVLFKQKKDLDFMKKSFGCISSER